MDYPIRKAEKVSITVIEVRLEEDIRIDSIYIYILFSLLQVTSIFIQSKNDKCKTVFSHIQLLYN